MSPYDDDSCMKQRANQIRPRKCTRSYSQSNKYYNLKNSSINFPIIAGSPISKRVTDVRTDNIDDSTVYLRDDGTSRQRRYEPNRELNSASICLVRRRSVGVCCCRPLFSSASLVLTDRERPNCGIEVPFGVIRIRFVSRWMSDHVLTLTVH